MLEIEIEMDYLFDMQRVSKLQLNSRGLFTDNETKCLDMKNEDGKIVHYYNEIERPLYVYDLEDNDLGTEEYMDLDEELSDSLNDSEGVIIAYYREM